MSGTIHKPKSDSFSVPVLIICFNRSQYITKQVEILRRIQAETIYIASDGPRNSDDVQVIKHVRDRYLAEIDWKCQVKTRFSPNNQGCFKGVRNALNWFFSEIDEGIVLEDDILPNRDFFLYSEAMLDYFREDKKIFCISGCNFGFRSNHSEVIFGKMMNMWGWAIWADRFREVDFSMQHWNNIKFKKLFLLLKLRLGFFDYDFGWATIWKDIFDEAVGNELYHTWDYQIIFNQIASGKFTVYPGVNLVKNLGFESDATHTGIHNHFMNTIDYENLNWPLTLNGRYSVQKHFYEHFMKGKWSFYNRPNWKYYLGTALKKIGIGINK